MEGLIPLVYRAIMQYKNSQHVMTGSWLLDESPNSAAYYVRLPGDSGRFQMPDACGFSATATTSSSSPSSSSSSNTRRLVNTSGVSSPAGCHLNTRRAVK